MAEESVLDAIELVNTEAVPRALTAAGRFEESLSDITSNMESFKRDADTQLESYRRDLNEQLTTAELRLDDTEQKLQVLMNRLSSDIGQREGEVEDSTSRRKDMMEDFASESEAIDKELDSFNSNLDGFDSRVDSLSSDIATGVSSYKEVTDGMHEQLGSAFDSYRELHSAAFEEITETLSEGTETIIEKMSSLKDNIEGNLEEQAGLYGEVIGLLTEQTGAEAEGFSEALEFAEQTVGSLGDIFDGSIGEISDKLEEISDLIESIKPILDFIDALT